MEMLFVHIYIYIKRKRNNPYKKDPLVDAKIGG